MKTMNPLFKTGFVLLLAIMAGCAPAPRKSTFQGIDLDNRYYGNAVGNQVTRIALKQLGIPYRYGGATRRGFDCSGLVLYSYRQMGIQLPRTARSQARAIRPVPISRLRPGDLVFFRIYRNRVSHVGIYYHSGLFIHAPKSGKRVSITSMRTPYWRKHYHGAGRVRTSPSYSSRRFIRKKGRNSSPDVL